MHGYKIVFQPKHDDKFSWLVVDITTGKWVDDFHTKAKAIEYVIKTDNLGQVEIL